MTNIYINLIKYLNDEDNKHYIEENFYIGEPWRKNYTYDITTEGQTFKGVHKDGYGGEGQGDSYWSVWEFTLDDNSPIYIKFDGWYASYDGANYTDWRIVTPKEVTRVEYS